MQKKYNKSSICSFDVDPQNCFTELCPKELPILGGEEIVTELNMQAKYARYRIGSKDAHSPNAIWIANNNKTQFSYLGEKNADIYWNKHAIVGTYGYELLSSLPSVTEYDFFVFKGVELDLHPYGACYHDLENSLSTGVIEFCVTNKIELIILGGLAFDYCVKETAIQLVHAGFQVKINLAATRATSDKAKDDTINFLTKLGVTFINSSCELEHV